MMAPAGGKLTARAVELAGTTTVSSYVTHAGSTGSWQQVTVTAPIVSGGDALTIAFFAPLVVGQFLLVDDISETCG
jgi:hypothetical protein